MKRAERACIMMQTLIENPNKDYSLGYFANLFSCAKSSVSEDLHVVRNAAEAAGLGYIETTAGAKGGVRFVPYIGKNAAKDELLKLKEALEDPSRVIGGGFLYTSDVMFDPGYMRIAAREFAKKFAATEADFVMTVETRGVGVAMMTAQYLNLPLIVLGRETRVADGSTVSINYFSGSTDRIQKMSVSRRAIKAGQKAIIIDDFMREGGSVKGIIDMLSEFDAVKAGVGVVMATRGAKERCIGDYFPIMILDDAQGVYKVKINPEIIDIENETTIEMGETK